MQPQLLRDLLHIWTHLGRFCKIWWSAQSLPTLRSMASTLVSTWEPVLGGQMTLHFLSLSSKFLLHGRLTMELLLHFLLLRLEILMELCLVDSFIIPGKDIPLTDLLNSFYSFSLMDLQVWASQASTLFLHYLNMEFPMALNFLPFLSTIMMLTFLMYVTLLISLLLVLVFVMMHMFLLYEEHWWDLFCSEKHSVTVKQRETCLVLLLPPTSMAFFTSLKKSNICPKPP